MQLLQERKLFLTEPALQPREVSIEDLQRYLDFTYFQQLGFKDPSLQRQLLDQGLKQLKSDQINPGHLENGNQWKKEIEKGFIPNVSVRWVDAEVQYGLFAEEDLEVGSFIGEYVGEVRKNNDRLNLSNYLYAYPISDEIGRNYVIDAVKGNLTRFINHSFSPNLNHQYAFVDGFYHMILTANQPIFKGSQLFFNYGKNYWYVRAQPKDVL